MHTKIFYFDSDFLWIFFHLGAGRDADSMWFECVHMEQNGGEHPTGLLQWVHE